ncbi:MAG: hypothetical protein IPN86_22180 [Saprospiraceae bacterium]|nr:hypothetical protein [Saprospiraceae bacterium]
MKFWEILLLEWQKKGRRGFTIPFIIGSYKNFNDSLFSVEELIKEIVKRSHFEVSMTICPDLGTIILTKNILPDNNSFFPTINGKEQNGLSINRILFPHTSDINDIILDLEEKFFDCISDSEYSASYKDGRSPEWRPFDTDDRSFIEQSYVIYKKKT